MAKERFVFVAATANVVGFEAVENRVADEKVELTRSGRREHGFRWQGVRESGARGRCST